MGGPQAGLIVGRADLIGKIRKHPLKRALRVGKLTLAALEPVLSLYRSPEFLPERLTTLKLLTRPASEIQAQALRFRPIVQSAVGEAYEVTDAPLASQIGSGALPVDRLASHGLAIRVIKGKRGSLDRLEGELRGLSRPVIGRVADKTLWLDLRCLLPADAAEFERQLAELTRTHSANADPGGAGSPHAMIVGTAGHIDHGKTTLVRALTGVDTDRLKEEKARGISIELGYAYTPLSDGDILGFVDVPGHERLVHTMAAGACGIDFALLVIAADDGVMPQTREHVAILQLFGVTRGAVALTKVDRVDDARLHAVEAEIAAFLSNTAFHDAPLFPVNATAAVMTPGRCALQRPSMCGTKGFPRASPFGARGSQCWSRPTGTPIARLFRLAIDRVFTLAGHGTVVAGTVFSGSVRVGDEVVIFPGWHIGAGAQHSLAKSTRRSG